MKYLNKFKTNYILLACLFLFFVISLISIYSIDKALMYKQLIWYIIGFILIFIISIVDNKVIYEKSWSLYIIGIMSLILVLIFGTTINGTRCWFKIPGIGNIQPSEYVKIILILILSKIIYKSKKDFKLIF